MITFDQVSVVYDGADRPVLRDVNLSVDEGDLCLSGRPYGGRRVDVAGRGQRPGPALHRRHPVRLGHGGRPDTSADHPPRELADVVGVVGQDPLDGCVTDTVEEELAYWIEHLAITPAVMRERVEETLDLLGLADLRHRALHDAGSSSAWRSAPCSPAHPRVLVLDEPTSALDPTAAEEVLAAVTRLVHDLGVTVLLAEHRLERVVQYADRVIHLPGDGLVVAGEPSEVFEASSIAPHVASWAGRPAGRRCPCRCATPARPPARCGPRWPASRPRRCGRRRPRRARTCSRPGGSRWRTGAFRRCARWTSDCGPARSRR
ncbi:ATP-binding cassette domain-containing protein [Streptomyces californicus]